MKCFTSYQRFNADTINGETLVVTSRYTTFDIQEMDAYENEIIRKTIGSGVITEFEMPKENSDDTKRSNKPQRNNKNVKHYTALLGRL